MGVVQRMEHENYSDGYELVLERIYAAREYMEAKVYGIMEPDVINVCRNRRKLCALWAVVGECENNPDCTFFEHERFGYLPPY